MFDHVLRVSLRFDEKLLHSSKVITESYLYLKIYFTKSFHDKIETNIVYFWYKNLAYQVDQWSIFQTYSFKLQRV